MKEKIFIALAKHNDRRAQEICKRHGFKETVTCLYCLEDMPNGFQDIPAHLDKCPRQFGE